jgi:hypothetical protein
MVLKDAVFIGALCYAFLSANTAKSSERCQGIAELGVHFPPSDIIFA